jgi:hypothetical protein
MNGATDFLGREIKAGDTIVYPVRRGSSMWLNRLLVTQVASDGVDRDGQPLLHVAGTNSFGRRITVKNLTNCVVVEPVAETLPEDIDE